LVHSTWEILVNLPCWSLLRSASLSLKGFILLFKERPGVSCGIDLTLIGGISSVWDILLFIVRVVKLEFFALVSQV
jgi:hypothetical protein